MVGGASKELARLSTLKRKSLGDHVTGCRDFLTAADVEAIVETCHTIYTVCPILYCFTANVTNHFNGAQVE
jgi:hypothetical protein